MRMIFRALPILIALTGCVSAPSQEVVQAPVALDPMAAERALGAGDYERAAALLDQLALEAKPPQRQSYQLRAAETLFNTGREAQAAHKLTLIDKRGVDARTRLGMYMLEARIALQRRDADLVLATLKNVRIPAAEPALAAEIHYLRAQAHQQLNGLAEAAQALMQREPYLANEEALIANQREIFDQLSRLPETELNAFKATAQPSVFGGWLELALLGKKSLLTPAQFKSRLAQWRSAYPSHPAREALLADLRARNAELGAQPVRIALLLPFSGNFQEAAAAVRDGVLAAYYESQDYGGVTLRTYDTNTDPQSAKAAYDRAVAEGAEFVIGPLTKEAVEAVAGSWSLTVPVLALNEVELRSPENFFQFGLAPEDEARQAAQRAWGDGMRRSLIIAPSGPWGTRIEQAFREKWQQLGGAIAGSMTYDPQESDYSESLRKLLALDASEQRHKRLESTLSRSLEFTARRRPDADFVFLAAFPRQARLLKPQLNFHHAADLPVYSTSHLFGGTLSPDLDRDMDGIVFGDMPWVLESRQSAALGRYDGQLKRLVAFGADAYKIMPFLRFLKRHPEESFEGATGTLQVDEDNRVRRAVSWARVVAGKPKLVTTGAGP